MSPKTKQNLNLAAEVEKSIFLSFVHKKPLGRYETWYSFLELEAI